MLSLSALRTHAAMCPDCSEQTLIALAVEILLEASRTSQDGPDIRPIVIINQQTMAERRGAAESLAFDEFVQSSFEPSYLRNMRPGGRKHYQFLLRRYIIPTLGALRLPEITFDHVQRLVQKMLVDGYSVQSARHVRGTLHCAFQHAVRAGHLQCALPTTGVRLPALTRVRERRALTIEQARAVLREFKTPYREMALVSMTTSMNLAELCGLKWSCVNLDEEPVICDGQTVPGHSVLIRQTYYEGAFGPPKTPRRRRVVPLPEAAVEGLRRFNAITRFSDPDHIVFASRNGTPKRSSNLRYGVIKPVGRRLGMPWLNWHAFRYTYATTGEQLSHSSVRPAGWHGSRERLDDSGIHCLQRRKVAGRCREDREEDRLKERSRCLVGAAGLEPATLSLEG